MISPTNVTTHFRRAAFERELETARVARHRTELRLRVRLDDKRRRDQQDAVDAWAEGR